MFFVTDFVSSDSQLCYYCVFTGHESSPELFEEPKKPCPTLSSSISLTSSSPLITTETEESSSLPNKKDLDDVFVVDLDKGQDGVGLGLIDGMVCWGFFFIRRRDVFGVY